MTGVTARWLRVAAIAALGSAAVAATAGAQSLAEVARKEAERRGAAKEPAKVYTNGDLAPDFSGPPPPPPAPAAAPPAARVATEPAKDKAAGKDEGMAADQPMKDGDLVPPPQNVDDKGEAYWRDRAAAVRNVREKARADIAALEERAAQLANAESGADRQEKQNTDAALRNLRNNIQLIDQEWERLQKDAERAKAPARWLLPQ